MNKAHAYNHEVWSSDPQHPSNNVGRCDRPPVVPKSWRQRQEIPWASWLVRLAKPQVQLETCYK